MKTKFINIYDVSEIDTTKITVYDLNKRYIDAQGNMYGLRYNRELKKVEIIRIMRTSSQHASYFTQKMMQNRKKENTQDLIDTIEGSNQTTDEELYATYDASSYESEKDTDYEYNENDDTATKTFFDTDEEHILTQPPSSSQESTPSDQDFKPDIFLDKKLRHINTHKERINGIIMNIENSKIVDREDRELAVRLDDLLRNIDIDALQRIDKVVNSYRELKEYPRSLSYYIGRLDNKGRNIVNQLITDEKRMRFIFLSEMHTELLDLYRNLLKLLKELLMFIEEVAHQHLSRLSVIEKQHVNDAKISSQNTIREINKVLLDLREFSDYIYNVKNFINA
jgi:hypothetical protein